MSTTDFMGRDGFIWFAGVVEDRQDPLKLGRVRVRCLGYHTEDKEALPTTDLPWAHPLLPITSSGVSGIGQTPLGLVEGSWVIGFFRDADTKQDAVILGALPGKPTTTGAQNLAEGLGFSDPNGTYPRHAENDVNRLARNDADNQSLKLVSHLERPLIQIFLVQTYCRFLIRLTLNNPKVTYGPYPKIHTPRSTHTAMYMRANQATY